MAHYVTESIWHFVGYMHLAELLSKTPLHYSGAGIYGLQTIQHSPAAPVAYAAAELLDDGREGLSASIELSAERHLTFLSRPLTIRPSLAPLDETDKLAFKLPAVKPPLDLAEVLPGVMHTASGNGRTETAVTDDVPLPKISATYTVGESQVSDVHIAQANALLDSDVLRGDPAALLEAGLDTARLDALSEGSAELAELVQRTMDLLPEDVIPASPADGIERVHATNDGELEVGLPEGSDVVAEAVGPGRYVNGEHTGDAGTSDEVIEAQVAKIEAAVGSAQPVLPDLAETHVSSDDPVHIVTGVEPTGGPAHEAIAGGNDAVNAAILYDLADAAGSMIVRGDVHVTDVIVQVNVLQDNDTVNASSAGALGTAILEAAIATGVEAGAIGGNAITNEAAFVQETGPVFGDVALGGIPGALNWQVDYVRGSLFDLTTVKQYNLVTDTDAVEQTTTGTHFVATLGENGALNFVQLQELGTSYDLIIIGGDYRELNAIIQVNLLLDDDSVEQAAGDPAAAQSIDAEGNTLANDAAIVRIGGDSYKPLGGNPEALADAIGGMQTEFDSSLATGLPGNGTDTLKILYITGDYYDYNILLQTNAVSDSDEIVQAAAGAPAPAAGEGDGEEPAALAQTADAGGNALQNLALLVNVDSTSDYQYVGGEVYEDTLLVQGEIIIDEDERNATDLHPDVVAAVAAQSGSADPTSSSDTTADQPHTGADADVMGGVLA